MPKLDKKGRPVSMLSQYERRELLGELLGVWEAHPRWGLGQLVSKVSLIGAGCKVDLAKQVDGEIVSGIRALVPDDWEVEEFDAHPASPVKL